MYLQCCSECSEPRMAQSLCTFCNKWLCFQCTDLHQHERSFIQPFDLQHQPRDLPSSSEIGAGCCGHAVVMCSLHKQEPLELLCETCDLMACSICHLSAHKDHRLVHVGKALQDQRWLLQNLMARVEEKRSAVESTAKQIQGRLHGIKITQRKAENQIKMAKMIMMNELNKRANLLIEQLEVITFSLQRLEDQLQGAIELCSQLERVQNFITWATAHHRCNPLLFSKELIALQMQQLLEPLMLSEAWTSLKIKFNWDASFWTKQMSTLGKLSYWTMALDGYFLKPFTFVLSYNVESELLQESDPSSQSELQVEFESDVISEQPSESVLSASEQEFESDPDSTAEVTLNLEPESEWVLPPAAGSETVSEPAAEHQPAEESPEIENEDFCAVCLIGGDLLCCDRCPKVFHLSCHVPPLHNFPIGDWICTLCRDVEQPEVEYDCENDQMSTALLAYGLSACDQRKCEKLTLLILSNILSAPFHEPVSPLARHYYQIIKKPMDLSVIRNRLSRTSNTHYRSPQEFVTDVLLMFKNCGKFNYPDSEVAQAGHSLQSFFTSKLREVFPDLTCPVQEEEDSENEDYEELERAMVTGFPWPERKEQSHRKRKRRHSLNWRRNHY
uniref:Tripartite motif containing 66 n=1 Tax=Sinocyclocheilus anshuiensis TaxID=1608454 RepID=A0A671SPR7_9TELE